MGLSTAQHSANAEPLLRGADTRSDLVACRRDERRLTRQLTDRVAAVDIRQGMRLKSVKYRGIWEHTHTAVTYIRTRAYEC